MFINEVFYCFLTQTCSLMYCPWLLCPTTVQLSSCSRDNNDPQNVEYLPSGPLQRKFTDPRDTPLFNLHMNYKEVRQVAATTEQMKKDTKES